MRSILTVTTAASDLALLTLAELRQATGIATGQEAELTTLGLGIAAAITSRCKVRAAGVTAPTLRLETLSETFRLDCSRDLLILARRPLVEIVSVTEDATAVVSTDYESENAEGFLRRLSSDYPAWWSASKIVVAYRAGWETVPPNLRNAAMKLASALTLESGRDPSLKRIDIVGVESREYWVGPSDDPLINREVEDLLADFINPAAA